MSQADLLTRQGDELGASRTPGAIHAARSRRLQRGKLLSLDMGRLTDHTREDVNVSSEAREDGVKGVGCIRHFTSSRT